MVFKIIPVFVNPDSLEMTVELTSVNANRRLVSVEHAQIYLTTINAHVKQDIRVGIARWYQQQMFVTHTLVSMELLVLKIPMIQAPVTVLLDTLVHSVKLMSTSA